MVEIDTMGYVLLVPLFRGGYAKTKRFVMDVLEAFSRLTGLNIDDADAGLGMAVEDGLVYRRGGYRLSERGWELAERLAALLSEGDARILRRLATDARLVERILGAG